MKLPTTMAEQGLLVALAQLRFGQVSPAQVDVVLSEYGLIIDLSEKVGLGVYPQQFLIEKYANQCAIAHTF